MIYPMARRSPYLRLLFAGLAAAQLAAPLMAVMADAAYARDAEWIGVHIEDHRGPHDHWPHRDDCAFCQFLAQHAIAAPGVTKSQSSVVAIRHLAVSTWSVRGLAGPFLPDWRAPPSA
jgi:hypothetical protein